MLISWNDVDYFYKQTGETLPYVRDLFEDQNTYIADVSEEVSSGCLYECTKQVWSTAAVPFIGYDNEEHLYFRKVFIFMLRSRNEITAQNVSENLYEEFIPFEDEFLSDEFRFLNAPVENSHIGIGELDPYEGYFIILTTARGPIALMVLSYIPPFSDDLMTELELAVHFANIQLDKLQRSAIIP